jgi:predicted nucleotidyltransferase
MSLAALPAYFSIRSKAREPREPSCVRGCRALSAVPGSGLRCLSGYPRHAVAYELRRREEGGVFTARMIGRSKLTRANADNPYCGPLSRLALMSFGPPQVIREELGAIDGIEQLFIFGSWAAHYTGEQGPAPHDVDVLIIGAPDRDEVYEAARRAQDRLGREVNTTIRKPEQWHGTQDGFTQQLRSSPLVQIPLQASDR